MLAEMPVLPPPTVVGDGYQAPRGYETTVFDETAPHQMNITWATESKHESLVLCNCGWVGKRWRPEVMGAIQAATVEYERHLVERGYVQPALLPEPPVRVCCMTRHAGPMCPDDTFMCTGCFIKVPVGAAWTDEDGALWDLCVPCGDHDKPGG